MPNTPQANASASSSTGPPLSPVPRHAAGASQQQQQQSAGICPLMKANSTGMLLSLSPLGPSGVLVPSRGIPALAVRQQSSTSAGAGPTTPQKALEQQKLPMTAGSAPLSATASSPSYSTSSPMSHDSASSARLAEQPDTAAVVVTGADVQGTHVACGGAMSTAADYSTHCTPCYAINPPGTAAAAGGMDDQGYDAASSDADSHDSFQQLTVHVQLDVSYQKALRIMQSPRGGLWNKVKRHCCMSLIPRLLSCTPHGEQNSWMAINRPAFCRC